MENMTEEAKKAKYKGRTIQSNLQERNSGASYADQVVRYKSATSPHAAFCYHYKMTP